MVPGTLAHSASAVTLTLAGKLCATSLGALRRRIVRARRTRGSVVIDLSEVTLIDRPALQFLAAQNGAGVQIINCPVYIESWLRKETR
jgi:anti-anti-sigma regulatory factor